MILKKLKSNKASSSLISFILIVPLFLGIVITTLDVSLYFSNRSSVVAAAQEGARYAAIIGGPGTTSRQTVIERSYGSENDCRTTVDERIGTSYFDRAKNTRTPTECVVLKNLATNTSLTLVDIQSVTCSARTPDGAAGSFTQSIGDTLVCEVNYKYHGLPGAPLHWIKSSSGEGVMTDVIVSSTANAEVGGAARTGR